MSAPEDKPLVGEELAKAIDSTPWPELTGDADASAYVDRVVYGKPAPWPEKWAGKTWRVGNDSLQEGDLRQAWRVIANGGTRDEVEQRLSRVLRHVYGSRFVDRALQLLRRERLIEFNRTERCWRAKA